MVGAEMAQCGGVLVRDGDHGVRLLADRPLEAGDALRLNPRVDRGEQAAAAAALDLGDHVLEGEFGVVRVIDQFGVGLKLANERQIDRHFQPLELHEVETGLRQQRAQPVAEAR